MSSFNDPRSTRTRTRTSGQGRPSARPSAARQAEGGQDAQPAKPEGPQYLQIAGLVAVVMVALLLFTQATSCEKRPAAQVEEESPYSTLYDWESLDTETDRYAFYVDEQPVSRLGIDVSDAQGDVDWSAVAKDGIDFAIVRVGYRGSTDGDVFTDSNFDANIDGAIDAGLDVGAYFYSQAVDEDEAREEAQRCLYEINGRKLQYPVVYDFEETASRDGRADGIDAAQAVANAKAFCEEIEDGGYSAMIYGNQKDLAMYNLSTLAKYPLWYAEYGSLPTSDYEFTLWQYTNQGKVSGIDTVVDLDIDLSKAPRNAQEEEAAQD